MRTPGVRGGPGFEAPRRAFGVFLAGVGCGFGNSGGRGVYGTLYVCFLPSFDVKIRGRGRILCVSGFL